MKFAFNRFEYSVFKEDNNFSIRKIYYNDDDLKAYSAPVSLQADNLENLVQILNDCIYATRNDKVITKNDFKNK